jgi:hypothetical protein
MSLVFIHRERLVSTAPIVGDCCPDIGRGTPNALMQPGCYRSMVKTACPMSWNGPSGLVLTSASLTTGWPPPCPVDHHIIDHQDQRIETPPSGFGASFEVDEVGKEGAGARLGNTCYVQFPASAGVAGVKTFHDSRVQVIFAEDAAIDHFFYNIRMGQNECFGSFCWVNAHGRKCGQIAFGGNQRLNCQAGIINVLKRG